MTRYVTISARAGGELAGESLVAEPWPLGLGQAELEEESGSSLHVGQVLAGKKFEVGCSMSWAAGKGGGLGV